MNGSMPMRSITPRNSRIQKYALMAETAKPIASNNHGTGIDDFNNSTVSKIAAPALAGISNRNEKRAAV